MSNLKALPLKKLEYTRAEPSTFRFVTKAPISQGKRLSIITRRNSTNRFYPECEHRSPRYQQLVSDAFWIKPVGLNRRAERLSMGIVIRIWEL